MKYLVAMSGGVDSSVAALLLLRSGHKVEGGIMRLSPFSDGSDVVSAQSVCDTLGIKLNVIDATDRFRTCVMDPFCRGYLDGLTPNPCVFCNNKLKFGYFAELAESLGFDGIATGHYADIAFRGGRYAVKAGACAEKDQSYFLWNVGQKALSRTVFPLRGVSSKDEVRAIARDAELPVASKSDSQDICFVKDGEYAELIEKLTGIRMPEGNFVDRDGNVLGRHRGLLNYTLGQRRFLNVAAGKRIYVVGKRPDENEVVLGDETELFRTTVRAKDVRMQLYPSLDNAEMNVKIRSGPRTVRAKVTAADGGFAEVVFEKPVRAPAPGQSVVFYDTDTVAGGGYIC